jgi:hypothetical protein
MFLIYNIRIELKGSAIYFSLIIKLSIEFTIKQ